MKAIKVKIINAHHTDDECMESLHDFCGVNDGDIVSAEMMENGTVFISSKDGENDTYLRECEYEVVE